VINLLSDAHDESAGLFSRLPVVRSMLLIPYKHKNLLRRFTAIPEVPIPHSTGQDQLSKAGTVLGVRVEQYSHKINVHEVPTKPVYVKVLTKSVADLIGVIFSE
jgi:hypothetical protein